MKPDARSVAFSPLAALLIISAGWSVLFPSQGSAQTIPQNHELSEKEKEEQEESRELTRRTVPQGHKPSTAVQRRAAHDLKAREDNDTGIYISWPKVYDDSSLQLLLSAARAQLATVQSINQAGLLSGIGAVTGASSTQTAFSAQVSGGPPIPQLQTVSNGATSGVQTVTGTTPGTTTTATAPNQVVTSTMTPPTAPTATLPTSSGFTPPATFSVNALGALNEQMQLTYEIANLSLLLEGSLTDRFVLGTSLIKPRTTVGFPITLTPSKKYKESVAVVDVEIELPQRNLLGPDRPAVTALLPREKTYNVAGITSNATSVGGGIVTQVVGAGFSFLHARNTYYIVQDQDTIALTMQPTYPDTGVAFQWQFKPVLGQSFVQPGMRQTFAQLTIPVNAIAGCFGTIHMKTYWRRFDRKTGRAGDVIWDSIRTYNEPGGLRIPVFDISPTIKGVEYEDLGSGQVEVKVEGQFLDGTYVRLGNSYLKPGVAGFSSEPRLIRFVAAANDLVKVEPKIVSRDGSEVRILNAQNLDPRSPLDLSCLPSQLPQADPPQQGPAQQPTPPPPLASIKNVQISTLDDTTSLLSVTVANLTEQPDPKPDPRDYLLNIANHLFGLSDAPITRVSAADGTVTLAAIVPSSLAASARSVSIQALFWNNNGLRGRNYKLTAPIPDLPVESSAEKIVLVGQDVVKESSPDAKPDKDTGKPALQTVTYANFMLTGNRLENAKIIMPSGVQLCCAGSMADSRTIGFFRIKLDDWKNYKGIVLEKTDAERPEFLALPAPDDKTSTPPTPILTPKYRITVGMDDAALTGSNLDKLKIKAVTYNKKPLNAPTVSADGKTMTLTGLVAAGVTTEPVTRDIEFEFEGGQKNLTVTLDVVNSKIETSPKN